MKTVAHEGPESETSPHLAWKLYAAPSSRIASMCGVSDHRSASGRQPSIAMTSVFRGVSLPLPCAGAVALSQGQPRESVLAAAAPAPDAPSVT